jgi:hypothetical protein
MHRWGSFHISYQPYFMSRERGHMYSYVKGEQLNLLAQVLVIMYHVGVLAKGYMKPQLPITLIYVSHTTFFLPCAWKCNICGGE